MFNFLFSAICDGHISNEDFHLANKTPTLPDFSWPKSLPITAVRWVYIFLFLHILQANSEESVLTSGLALKCKLQE